MNASTIELENTEITRKGIKAIIDFYLTMAIDYRRYSNLLAIATGADSPFLNVVIDTRTQKEKSIQYIYEFTDFFDQHKVPFAWMVTPVAKNNDLERYGVSILEEAPSMYYDLTAPLADVSIPSLIIEEMHANDDLSRWIKPLNDGFPSKDHGEYFRALNAELLQQGEKKLRQFIGLYQGEPVIGGTLFLSKNAAMLHNIATKKAFQRRGFATAFTLHLMNFAKDLGFKHCYLDSSEEGFHLYQKLGFKIYAKNIFYQIDIR